MKIQRRITLTSLILITGLLLSSALLFFRFSSAYGLKEFQLETVGLNESLARFSDSNIMLFSEETHPRMACQYWLNDLVALEEIMATVMDSDDSRRLGRVYRSLLNTRKKQWKDFHKDALDPMILEINRFMSNEISVDAGFKGLYRFYLEEKKIGHDDVVEQLERIVVLQAKINRFTHSFIESMKDLNDESEKEVNTYIRQSFIIVFTTIVLILLVSLIISARFSRTMVLRINETGKQVDMMLEGNLEYDDSAQFKDEFDELVHDYHYFSTGLSERLNSLKILLQDIGNAVNSDTDLQSFEETVLELGIDSLGADAALLFLVDNESRELTLAKRSGFCPPPFQLSKEVSRVRSNVENYFETHHVKSNTPVLGPVMAGSSIFIKNNSMSRELPDNADSTEWQFISSYIALPLIVGKRLLGMMVFCTTHKDKLFSDLDFSFIKSYADYTAQAIDNLYKYQSLLENREIQREIDIAAGIQKRLLPSVMPDFKSGSARIHSKPARGISGDYFDAIRLDDEKILYTVCDVAGKGVPASMLMIMIRTILHTICARHRNANTLMKELNYHIAGRIGVDQYATMAVFILDENKKEISYSNAAHHPLYLYRKSEEHFRSFDTDGLPIGVDKDSDFGHKRIRLDEGDYLFLFTDGLPEARSENGKELSVSQLLRFLGSNIDKTPEELIPSVDGFIEQFAENAKQHDDQTFLALQIHS